MKTISERQQLVLLALFLAAMFFVGDLIWWWFDPEGHRALWGNEESPFQTQEPGPTAIVATAFPKPTAAPQEDFLQGFVCQDLNRNRVCDPEEPSFAGIQVEVFSSVGSSSTLELGAAGAWVVTMKGVTIEGVTVILPEDRVCEAVTTATPEIDYQVDAVWCQDMEVPTPTATTTRQPAAIPAYVDPLEYEGLTVTVLEISYRDGYALIQTREGDLVRLSAPGYFATYATEWRVEDGLSYRSDYGDLPVTGVLQVKISSDPGYDFLDPDDRIIRVVPPSPPLTEKDKQVLAAWPGFAAELQNGENLAYMEYEEIGWIDKEGRPHEKCTWMGVTSHEFPWLRRSVPSFCDALPVEFTTASTPPGFDFSFTAPPAYHVLACETAVNNGRIVVVSVQTREFETYTGLVYKYPLMVVLQDRKTGEHVSLELPAGGFLAVFQDQYTDWEVIPAEAWVWYFLQPSLRCGV